MSARNRRQDARAQNESSSGSLCDWAGSGRHVLASKLAKVAPRPLTAECAENHVRNAEARLNSLARPLAASHLQQLPATSATTTVPERWQSREGDDDLNHSLRPHPGLRAGGSSRCEGAALRTNRGAGQLRSRRARSQSAGADTRSKSDLSVAGRAQGRGRPGQKGAEVQSRPLGTRPGGEARSGCLSPRKPSHSIDDSTKDNRSREVITEDISWPTPFPCPNFTQTSTWIY